MPQSPECPGKLNHRWRNKMFGSFDIHRALLLVVPVLLALTIHEYAHALAAHRLGDNTAKDAGRLTLNPLPHLDPIGALVLFFSQLFGWAKPVPFNPANFKNPVRDSTLVALAGPVSNLIAAVAVAIILKLLIIFNVFAVIPPSVAGNLADILTLGILINVAIGVFNMLPLPPLDGFKVLSYFLPHRWVAASYQYSSYFFMGFIALIIMGLPQKIIGPVVYFLQSLIFRIVIG